MQIASRPEPAPLDLAVSVDHDAEPVEFDQVVAEFLLNYVRKQRSSADLAGGQIENTSEDKETGP
jgi:hypothetical protein